MVFLGPIPVVIQPYLEFRERFERRINPTFNSFALSNRSDLLSRWRPGFYVKPAGPWLGEVQYQYSHDLVWTDSKNNSTENSNLSLGYVRYSDRTLSVTGGRQKIPLGDERLVGPSEWLNVPRSFDGMDVRWHAWELFDFAISVLRVPDARLGGLVRHRSDGETSLLYKHDHPGAGTVDEYTLDERCNKSFGNWGVHFEGALQAGQARMKTEDAWAVHLKVDRSLQKGMTLFAEGNIASGGSSATRTNTFDNLYPSNHDKHGMLDLQAWKNMTEISLGLEFAPVKNLKGRLSWQRLWLYDPTDAWYTYSGAAAKSAHGSFLDASGSSGRDIGEETDLTLVWNVNKGPTVSAGLGLFDPGRFVKSVGGVASQQTYGYLMLAHRFR